SVLSGVRRPLGPDSLRGRGELELELPDDVWVDVEIADAHLDSADRDNEAGRHDAAQREAACAADILQDEFLPGCGGPWVEERRAELEELGRHARELESRAALATGDAAAAERIARRLCERAPYRESAHGVLMEALAAQCNVAEALLAYDRLVHVLRDDLGAVPAPAIAAFHEQLLVNGQPPPPARPRAGARRRRPGPRGIGIALACAGLAIAAAGLIGDDASGGQRPAAERMLPTQEAVLSAQRVAFRYPKDWPLRAPAGGLTGTGNGDSFCNIFRVPGAARPGWSDATVLRYARARMRAWERHGHGHLAGAVRAVRGEEQAGATALETDSAYGSPERGRVTFF